jgi:hypothetical protein
LPRTPGGVPERFAHTLFPDRCRRLPVCSRTSAAMDAERGLAASRTALSRETSELRTASERFRGELESGHRDVSALLRELRAAAQRGQWPTSGYSLGDGGDYSLPGLDAEAPLVQPAAQSLLMAERDAGSSSAVGEGGELVLSFVGNRGTSEVAENLERFSNSSSLLTRWGRFIDPFRQTVILAFPTRVSLSSIA